MSRPICRHCRRRVIWAVTERTRPIPLDPNPNPDGNVALSEPSPGRRLARVLTSGEQPTSVECRYMPHFATCPALNRRSVP
jgi:hypothetical protein